MLAAMRERLREHGLEWLLELAIPQAEAEEIVVYLDAIESGREYRTPRRISRGKPWIALIEEGDGRTFARFKRDRALLRPKERSIRGWSLQGAGRAPIEHLFREETVARPGEAVTVHFASDGTLSFDALFIADEVSLAILREIDFGGCSLEILGQRWDDVYDGRPIYRIADGRWRDVELCVFKDAGDWDYVEWIRLPDGRSDRIDSDVVLDWDPTDPSPWEDAPVSERPSRWDRTA